MIPSVRLRSLPPALLLSMATGVTSAQGATDEYTELDNVESSFVMLNAMPIRPMVVANDHLWVVNTNDSTIERFERDTVGMDPPFVQPATSFIRGVPWAPVSIATWDDPSVDAMMEPELVTKLLIVCRGSWALVVMNETDGAYERIVKLPGEPGDILVVGDDAFVSCMGEDTVVQIDLTGTNPDVFYRDGEPDGAGTTSFQIKSPLFLSPAPPSVPGGVLVSALHSGNNTTPKRDNELQFPSSTEILDLDDAMVDGQAVDNELPDNDLFLIDPSAGDGAKVSPYIRGAGTTIFAHGYSAGPTGNTNDDLLWILNTDAINVPDGEQSEPNVRGVFIENRITTIPVPLSPTPPSFFDFDAPFDELMPTDTKEDTLGQPFSLVFDDDGNGYVCGVLSDNVWRISNTAGALAKVAEWDLEGGTETGTGGVPSPGAIPRGLLIDNDRIYAYCWGLGEIQWSPLNLSGTAGTLTLNYDPTPPEIAAGRRMFFDGTNSLKGSSSCASCHIDGGSDFITWNLSNKPFDDKGALFTQTLVGINRMGPFHWRGERTLRDFEGAFDALLGFEDDPATPDVETLTGNIADMEAFMLALTNPANPIQEPDRLVHDDVSHPTLETAFGGVAAGEAIRGQTDWNEREIGQHGGNWTCGDCHQHPLGTSHDLIAFDPLAGVARNNGVLALEPDRRALTKTVEGANFKVGPYHELWRKFMPFVEDVPFVDDARPLLGADISHAGLATDLAAATFKIQNSIRDAQMINFVAQWDQGLAPAVHEVLLVTDPLTQDEIDDFLALRDQAQLRNCDFVVLGLQFGGGEAAVQRAAYDRQVNQLIYEDGSGVPPYDPIFQVLNGDIDAFVAIGLPVGMGRRFGIDYDYDDLLNREQYAVNQAHPFGPLILDEFPNRYDYNPLEDEPFNFPTTPPQLVGTITEPLWQTTSSARVQLSTDRNTAVWIFADDVTTGESFGPFTSPYLGRDHSVLLTGLRPSTSMYSVTSNPEGTVETVSEETVTYDLRVFLLGQGGNPPADHTAFTLTDFLTMEPFAQPSDLTSFTPDPRDPAFDAEDRMMAAQHYIHDADFSLDATNTTGTATIEVRHVRGGVDVNHEKNPASDRLVVARIFTQRGVGPIAVESVTPSIANVHVVGEFWLKGEDAASNPVNLNDPNRVDDMRPNYVTGDLILAKTNASGIATFEFDLSSALSSDDAIWFDVEAIVEVPSTFTVPSFAPRDPEFVVDVPEAWDPLGQNHTDLLMNGMAYSQWNFPRSTEARTTQHVEVP